MIDYAKPSTIDNGYKIYKNNKVLKKKQINDNQFIGYIDDLDNHHNVMINLDNPKTSYCDCNESKSKIICKHMIALYFSISKIEAEIYDKWIKDYYEEYGHLYDEEYYKDILENKF